MHELRFNRVLQRFQQTTAPVLCGASGADGRQESLDLRIVTERPAYVHVYIHIAWSEDKAPAELERVLAETVLAIAGRAGASAGPGVVSSQKVQDVGLSETGGAVGEALPVDQEREGDAGFIPEEAGIVPVTQANGGEVRAFLFESQLVVAQLRDVLAAEDSTVMAQEHEHGWTLFPERAQTHVAPVQVGQDDGGERFA